MQAFATIALAIEIANAVSSTSGTLLEGGQALFIGGLG